MTKATEHTELIYPEQALEAPEVFTAQIGYDRSTEPYFFRDC